VLIAEKPLVSIRRSGIQQIQTTAPRAEHLNMDNRLEETLSGSKSNKALSKREKQILEFVLAGNTNGEIAQKIYRTERTVEYHRNRLMKKLGTHTIVELVKYAIAMGIA
jgi:two-component system, NarL family, response regulator DegU